MYTPVPTEVDEYMILLEYISCYNLFVVLLVVLYAVSAVYFAGVMVRLMLTLTPVVCVLASVCVSHTLDNFMKSTSKEGIQWFKGF